MEQYAHDDQTPIKPVSVPTLDLKAQVTPQFVELNWNNQILRVPNPAHVAQLHNLCRDQALEIQQLKEKHVSMQQQIQALQRAVAQIQNRVLS